MKTILLPLLVMTLTVQASLGGNWFGPGPFANGAFFPGQFDGVYSATMFGGAPSIVSGVLGFGLRNGSPSTQNETALSDNGTQNTISVDPFQNYFVVFINGRSYAGLTIANINNQVDSVSGGLFNGQSASTFLVTPTVVVPGTPPLVIEGFTTEITQTCGGGFNATLTGKKAIITFSGNETGTLQASENGAPVGVPNTFSLNGLKVGFQTAEVGNSAAQ